MNFYKRAIASMKRRPGKSMILLILVFLLGTMITGAIAVENAITNTDTHLRNSMRPIVSFEASRDALIDEEINVESLTAEIVRQIAALPQVARHNYSVGTFIGTQQLNDYSVDSIAGVEGLLNYFTFQGTSTEELFEMQEGVIERVSGRDQFTSEEVTNTTDTHPIIISQELAQLNNLSVGSIVDLDFGVMRMQPSQLGLGGGWDDNFNHNSENIFATENFRFEVIGIFNIVVDEELDQNSSKYMDAQFRALFLNNTIFTPNHVSEQLVNFNETAMYEAAREALEGSGMTVEDVFGADFGAETETQVESVMELLDPSYLEEFRSAAEEILPEHWYVTDLSNSFADVASSMETMQSIASWILWVSLGATLLILSLLITLFLRDRRYEMGVYLALGERKTKVISQILLEVVATAFIGITLAVFTGSIISDSISQSMLRDNLIAQQESDDNMIKGFLEGSNLERMGFSNDMTTDEMLEAFEITLDGHTVGLFYAIGLGAVILSTVIPVIYIVTLNPKKVLMGT